MKNQTIAVCGMRSVRALWEKRPEALKHLVFTADRARELGDLCSQLAKQKRSYTQHTLEELDNVAGTTQHEGVAAICSPLGIPSFRNSDAFTLQKAGEPMILIEDVHSPHMLANIVKTAVATRVRHIILKQGTCLSALTHRDTWLLSEGAMESVNFYQVSALFGLIKSLQSSFLTVAGLPTGRGGRNIDWNKRPNAPGRPFALVLSENADVWNRLAPICEAGVQIPQLASELPMDVLGGLLIVWLRGSKAERLAESQVD